MRLEVVLAQVGEAHGRCWSVGWLALPPSDWSYRTLAGQQGCTCLRSVMLVEDIGGHQATLAYLVHSRCNIFVSFVAIFL